MLAEDPRLLSPTRFHNSVHNAAAGYWTIAAGCTAAYTALSAGRCTFAEGLLEALVEAECSGAPVLYVAYDIEARGALASMAPSSGVLGAALVLGPPASPAARAMLRWRIGEAREVRASTARPDNAAHVGDNAMLACLPLFEALAGARAGPLQFLLGPHALLHIDLEPPVR
jgi:hypothetical protein